MPLKQALQSAVWDLADQPHRRSNWTNRLRNSSQRRFRVVDRLDQATVEQLIQDYRDGTPTQALGDRYGLSKTSVTNLLQAHGIPIRTRRHLRDDLLQGAIRLYQEGWSTARIGDHLGFDGSTVWLALKKAGVDHRPRRGWRYG